jgi:hypothetical protein
VSVHRLQLEEFIRDEERRAQEERIALHEPLPAPRPVVRPLELRGPFDEAADRVLAWWRMREGGGKWMRERKKKPISNAEVQRLVRELRAMGKPKSEGE